MSYDVALPLPRMVRDVIWASKGRIMAALRLAELDFYKSNVEYLQEPPDKLISIVEQAVARKNAAENLNNRKKPNGRGYSPGQ